LVFYIIPYNFSSNTITNSANVTTITPKFSTP